MVKFHIRTRLSESFLMMIGFGSAPKKSCTSHQFTPYANWSATKHCFTTLEGGRLPSEVRLENCTQVWGWANFGHRATHGGGKIALHTCSDLSKLVRTCLNQSVRQWPCMLIAQCHFLHFRMLLFTQSQPERRRWYKARWQRPTVNQFESRETE